MGWEREYEHWRDMGHTWGPGIDDRREPTEKELAEAEAQRKAYEEELASIRVDARKKWIQKGKELENSIPELKKLAEEGYPYDWRQRYSVKKIQLCKKIVKEMGYSFQLRNGNEDKNKFQIKVTYYGYLPERIGNIHSFVASGIGSPRDCLQLVADFGAIGCSTTTFYQDHFVSMDDTARLRKEMEKWGVDFEEKDKENPSLDERITRGNQKIQLVGEDVAGPPTLHEVELEHNRRRGKTRQTEEKEQSR